ncbi:MAG: PP2C family protein-serine/threonine phosphatase [Ignavibacteria bacterium]|nr:PP2C family protein-serine/threonine phosphatase [Ignavibacteria bacterium]
MNSTNQNIDSRLLDTLKRDLKQEDFVKKLQREFRELKEFYIEPSKKLELERMNWLKRGFFIVWWILKSMILKLTPLRRILLLVGTLLVISGRVVINGEQISSSRENLFGCALILLVLMLELKDKLLARDELEAGQKVQLALLPERCPIVSGWELWLYTRPANEVGGDLVDFIKINDNRFAVAIADIAGKGLQAALLTTKLQATIRALTDEHESISKLVSKINNIFFRDSLRNIFASLLYLEITPNSNKINYVNAGHLPPLLIKANSINELSKGEAALGLMSGNSYNEQICELHTGDIFVAYSDGLIEAQNRYKQFYGSERLFKLLQNLHSYSPKQIGERIVFEIEYFIGDARANDDLSLIILKKV